MMSQITQATPLLVFSNLVMILGIYVLLKKATKYPFILSPFRRNVSIILMFVFVMFSFWGNDYFHYLEIYPYVLQGEEFNLEYVYVWIIQNISIGYTSFRIIVWGCALYLYLLTIRRLSINSNIALFFFGTICLIWFSYTRASLAMVMVYYGMSLLYKPNKNKYISFIWGLGWILCSVFFHKSAIFAAGISLLVYFLSKANNKIAILCICTCFIAIMLGIDTIVSSFLNMDSGEDNISSKIISSGQGYAQNEILKRGIVSAFVSIFEVTFYYLLAWCCFSFCKGNYKDKSKDIVSYMHMLIMIVLFSSIFLLNIGIETTIIFERLLRFGFIPASIVMAYFWQHGYFHGIVKFAYRLFFATTLMSVLYSMYCRLV